MTILIGVAIGLILGLTGAGGSIFAVPLLYLLLEVPINDAMGISLGAVCAAALVGVFLRLKSRDIKWATGITLSLWGMLAAPVGRYSSTLIPEQALLAGFSVLASFLAIRMWQQANQQTTPHVRASIDGAPSDNKPGGDHHRHIIKISGAGLICGFLSGLFGVGGGFVIVPVLTLYAGIKIHQAVGTSLLVISLISSTGFAFHITQISGMPSDLLYKTTLGSIVGILLGTLVARQLAGPQLQKIFAVSVIGLMSITLTQAFI